MSLAHGILGFLNFEKMSGYDLAKAFNASVQFFWYAQNSQIYLVLDKLEKDGLVTHEVVVQTDKPSKKLYSVTDAGREELFRWLSDSGENAITGFKSAFLMKIFFSGNTEPEQGCALLRKFIDDCRAYMETMTTVPDSVDHYSQSVPAYAALYWEFTADFAHNYLNMCIEWAESCISRLEEL